MDTLVYDIKPNNIQAHIDLESDIIKQQDGLFTFTIHVSGGDIVDYIVMGYESYNIQPTAPCNSGEGSD